MEKLSASTGWLWVKEGFSLYRKKPAEVTTLFLSYMFLMLTLSIVPIAGQLLPVILMPAFTLAFMQACVHIEQGKRVYPSLLLTGFRAPAFRGLVKLGVLYLVMALIALGITSLFDDGYLWQIMSGQIALDEKTIDSGRPSLSMLVWTIVFAVVKLPFWYATPLIAWQNMNFSKAVFYSVVTVYRTRTTFLMYGLAWTAVGIFLPAIASMLVVALFGKGLLSSFIFFFL
jgi:hypothetical protein